MSKQSDGRSGLARSGDSVRRDHCILLVEDEELVRRFAIRALRHLGYTVLAAADGGAAVELAERLGSGSIQLLLTDVSLPDMGGMEVAAAVRRVIPGVPVLYSSGVDLAEAAVGGAQDEVRFLPKPYSMADLARMVESAIESAD